MRSARAFLSLHEFEPRKCVTLNVLIRRWRSPSTRQGELIHSADRDPLSGKKRKVRIWIPASSIIGGLIYSKYLAIGLPAKGKRLSSYTLNESSMSQPEQICTFNKCQSTLIRRLSGLIMRTLNIFRVIFPFESFLFLLSTHCIWPWPLPIEVQTIA